MMKGFNLLERYFLLQAVFFGVMGIVTLLDQDFILSKTFYGFLIGYAMLGGVLRVTNFFLWKDCKTPLVYCNLLAGGLLVLLSIHLIAFARYLVPVTPVLLSGILSMEGMFYLIIACQRNTALQKRLLIPLSVAMLIGSLTVSVFSIGFGVNGLLGLAWVSGCALLISCVYCLTYCIVQRAPLRLRAKGE